MSKNSTPTTIDRNSGIYQFVFFGSGVIGNVYWYFQFKDSHEIRPDTRNLFVSVLLAIALAGAAVYCLILPMPWAKEDEDESARPENPLKMVQKSARMLASRELLMLSAFFCYDGWAAVALFSLLFWRLE